MCVCVLCYLACSVHAPYYYCHLWPVWLYHIFSHYLINGTIFGKNDWTWNVNACFDFLYNFCLKYFSFKEEIFNSTINAHMSSCTVLLFSSDFNETWISSKDFRQILKYQILRKSVLWEPSYMRTGRHDKTNSRCLQFCDSAWKLVRARTHF